MNSDTAKAYLLTILISGLRRNEPLPLEKKMVDLEERTIFPHDTKNNKPFLIPIPRYLHKFLKVHIKANEGSKYVFQSRIKGQHITELQSGIDQGKKVCGVEFCSHDIRRLFAAQAEALDLSPFVIKRLVNHSLPEKDSNTIGIYIASDLVPLRGPTQKIDDRILSLADVTEKRSTIKLKMVQ